MQTNLTPAYVYREYADDQNIQALNTSFNQLAQQYIDWFNTVGLPVYTGLSDGLLDWVCEGLYGLKRPVLTNGISTPGNIGNLYGSVIYGFAPYGTPMLGSSVIPAPFYYVNDDFYKRILTWRFYKGDGFYFTVSWLKRRIARFMSGVNGTAPNIDQTNNISVTISNNHVVTITLLTGNITQSWNGTYGLVGYGMVGYGGYSTKQELMPPNPTTQYLADAVRSGILDLPFQYMYQVIQ